MDIMSQQKIYRVTGSMRRVLEWEPFTKYVYAVNENVAKQYTLSLLGSKHRLRRFEIRIKEVKPVNDPKEVDDPVLRAYIEKGS